MGKGSLAFLSHQMIPLALNISSYAAFRRVEAHFFEGVSQMNIRVAASVLCLLFLTSLSGCAPGAGSSNLQARIDRQDQQIQQLLSQAGQSEQMRPGQAELWAQMQTMRQELNILTGKIDTMQGSGPGGELPRLQEKVARLEGIVRQMGSQLAINTDALNAPDASVPSGSSSAPSYALPSTATSPAAAGENGMPRPLAVTPDGDLRQPSSSSSTAPKDTATTVYDEGIKAFDEQRYKDAVVTFKDFVGTFPKHSLAGNAHFWEGESYFQLKDYPRAALAYQEVISKYPGSPKVQSAMLKQGIALHNANKKPAAQERLQELIKRYPNSPEATRAKQFLDKNK